jgi:hypothetical protein
MKGKPARQGKARNYPDSFDVDLALAGGRHLYLPGEISQPSGREAGEVSRIHSSPETSSAERRGGLTGRVKGGTTRVEKL